MIMMETGFTHDADGSGSPPKDRCPGRAGFPSVPQKSGPQMTAEKYVIPMIYEEEFR